ncbi:hypothetical protein P9436_16885 [Lysinibacillus capsici]|uniref:hypothetical protein n=1 Tax=Lysinibacillus capsici TaxID=2115968 RepID=UPI0001DA5AD8|nr:hypothetical protein [Lysinibacillus capsici]EFI67241.1 hypothetical protein BFZC1_17984 [Lysinibacillus fusiformis ZC1]MED4700734.1 hypothetical protein [Lysinibacillus capsici]UNT53677.1 hypothetical protein ICJ70_14115 [Lysinibacillus capsici]
MDTILNIKDKPSFDRMARLLGTLTEEQQRSIENYIKGYESGIQAGIRIGKTQKSEPNKNQILVE